MVNRWHTMCDDINKFHRIDKSGIIPNICFKRFSGFACFNINNMAEATPIATEDFTPRLKIKIILFFSPTHGKLLWGRLNHRSTISDGIFAPIVSISILAPNSAKRIIRLGTVRQRQYLLKRSRCFRGFFAPLRQIGNAPLCFRFSSLLSYSFVGFIAVDEKIHWI